MEDKELEKLMRRKMLQYMKMAEKEKLKREEEERIREKKESLLRTVLTQEGYRYLSNLRKREMKVANQLENIVLYLFLNGQLRRKLTELEIEYIERKIKGEGGRIYVKTKKGTLSFEEFLRKSD